MKLEIWKEPPPPQEEEKVTRLRLLPGLTPGSVKVVAVDKNGIDIGAGVVAEFTLEGLVRRKHLTSRAGFALDGSSRIKELESF